MELVNPSKQVVAASSRLPYSVGSNTLIRSEPGSSSHDCCLWRWADYQDTPIHSPKSDCIRPENVPGWWCTCLHPPKTIMYNRKPTCHEDSNLSSSLLVSLALKEFACMRKHSRQSRSTLWLSVRFTAEWRGTFGPIALADCPRSGERVRTTKAWASRWYIFIFALQNTWSPW